eukprot:644075-Amphidinium_carterae.1
MCIGLPHEWYDGSELHKSLETGVLASQRRSPRRCNMRTARGVASSSVSSSVSVQFSKVEPRLGGKHAEEALDNCSGVPMWECALRGARGTRCRARKMARSCAFAVAWSASSLSLSPVPGSRKGRARSAPSPSNTSSPVPATRPGAPPHV